MPTRPDSDVRGIVLLRHGETTWNRDRRVMGHEDVALSTVGRAQCQSLAEALAEQPIDRIVSSPLARAMQSAEIVAARLGVDVTTDDRLLEVRFGRWQGHTYEEIVGEPEYLEFLRDPLRNPTPGGETIADVQRRGLDAVEQAASGEIVLFVSHGDIIRSVICHFLAVPLEEFRRIRVDNCGLTAITEAGGRAEVKFVNWLADADRAWRPLHWSRPG